MDIFAKGAHLNKFLMVAASMLVLGNGAQAVELRVLEWEGYISTFQADFEAYAKSKGKDVTLSFPKKADGGVLYIASADDIFQQLRDGTADVVTPTGNYYKGENGKLIKLLHALDLNRLASWPGVYPKLKAATFARDESGKTYGLPLLGGSYALAYNSDKAAAPASWQELLAPAAKGKFLITSDQFEANIYQMALLAGVKPVDVYDYDKYSDAQRAATQDNLKKLVANAADFWGGMPYPKDMKTMNYVTDYWFGVAAANKDGQHWRFASPKEGVTVWLDTLAIAKAAEQNPAKLEAAYVLADFMLSPAVQARIHQEFGSVIITPEARPLLTAEQQAGLPGEDFFDAQYFWQPLNPRTRNAFRGMWDAAVKERR